jgi:O-antigen/teichoic acid export membrane protein
LRRIIGPLAGLTDAGFAALANLMMGVFAVRELGTTEVALFSLLFAGWVTSQLLPAQVSFVAARLAVNTMSTVVAPNLLLDLRRAAIPLLTASLFAAASGLPQLHAVGFEVYIWAALGCAALTLVAPIQAHVRAGLHLVGNHGAAATISGITFIVSLVAFIAALSLDFGKSAGYAFTTVAAANAISVLVGAVILRRTPTAQYTVPRLGTRITYLGADLIIQASNYFVNVAVSVVLGSAALATLEAARVLTSPIAVVAIGLSAFFVPSIIRRLAADPTSHRSTMAKLSGMIVLIGAVYSGLMLVLGDRLGLVLGTHADPTLSAARSGASTLEAAGSGVASVLFATGRSLTWVGLSAISSIVTLGLLFASMPLAGVFGVPIAQAAGSLVRVVFGYRAAWTVPKRPKHAA